MPAQIITPTLVQSLRARPHLPANTWYFVAGVALSVLNRPEEIPNVLSHAIERRDEIPSIGGAPSKSSPSQLSEDASHVTRRLREALIKTVPIAGLPKTINALLALKHITPAHLLDTPDPSSLSSRSSDVQKMSPREVVDRGQRFFDTVYGKVSYRVMSQMDQSGAEDLGLIARLLYGHVLSNTSILSATETSFVLIAGLIPQDVNAQLKGHLKGALNNGAALEEVRAVREVVMDICEASGMKLLDKSCNAGWGWRKDVATL